MRPPIATSLGLACLVALPGCARDESAAVLEAFRSYREAVQLRDGPRARAAVDANTIEYYDRVLALALEAGWEALDAQPILVRLTVLQTRLSIPAADLRGMTGEALFVRSVEDGLIDPRTVQGFELTGVVISGDDATAIQVVDGRETALRFVFHRQEGAWRFDLTSLLPSASESLAAAVRQSGRSEREFLTAVLGAVSGREVTEELWVPVGR